MDGFLGMLPKSLGNDYFTRARTGAEEAARELGVELRWDGPRDADPNAQAAIVERWVKDGAAAIAPSVEDPKTLSPVLRRARAQGVRVLTWDADAEPDARDHTVVPASPDGIAQALAFEAGRMTGGSGEVAVVTSTETSPNQARWLRLLTERLAKASPGVRVVAVRACLDDEERARVQARALVAEFPSLAVIVGLCAPAVPGAARAVAEAARPIRITGVSEAHACREAIEAGRVDSIVTWSVRDLGYLTVAAAARAVAGELAPGVLVLRAGRLGNVVVQGDEVRLGRPHIVTRGNLASLAG